MMMENTAGLYAAFKAKDARFDGRFFVGISSTGIYCRPVCRAKLPKAENCAYYRTAAEAEQAGYRPCLLCRPELAPGASVTDAGTALACRAAKMLEENCGGGFSLDEIAGRLGCTDRHLRRVFTAEYNVSPVQYLQTCRLLLAKNLLTETGLSVLDVALASGFGSLRRFNELFKKHYNLAPSALRKKAPPEKRPAGEVTLALGYRPPYPWEQMLKFLAGRAVAGVEVVRNGEYLRTVRMAVSEPQGRHERRDREDAAARGPSSPLSAAMVEPPLICGGASSIRQIYGWVRVGHRPEKNALSVTVGESLLPVLPQVLARVRSLFDLCCDPAAVYETLQVMNDIRPGLCVLGARLPGCFDPFEIAVRAVLGQQITVKAAGTLAARLVESCGRPVQTGIDGLSHAFPSPEDILALGGPVENHLGPLGVIAARAKTIYELALAIQQGDIDPHSPQPEEEIKKLMSIRGIGSWTAQYIAMRAMQWPDSFLETDAGVKKALPGHSAKELTALAEAWRPWRSYATINLWNAPPQINGDSAIAAESGLDSPLND
ncbi:helix-turn-helix domain-containing protein [Deltaproteobacteria bacterium OttesenSCG-928-K17]|nr:helix-turn-helix domain-containing protein [Deltaproteobacteria bacterium OttesenSCG-928-K17]